MLNDRDRRRLADIERRLIAEDPELDRQLSKRSRGPHSRLWVWVSASGLLGFCAGALTENGLLVVFGFVAIVISAMRGLMLWGERIRAAEERNS